MQPELHPGVRAWTEDVVIPTYLPAPPDKNPMFLEKRVYQGSSGKVYPLPFTDRIAETSTPRAWKAAWIENEYLKVMILPELGGRIHRVLDKTNEYDLIYYQPVIKPALVGLAGPWASGGVEFNWPQHHRPATFLPVDCEIEEHADGSKTVWCSDHDPMLRMKGMHGICLHPGRAVLELKVRAYNRTPLVQTFLWWANVATRVHTKYQSFFPPDVRYVADHARRAMSTYPLCQGSYYGIDYAEREMRNASSAECGRKAGKGAEGKAEAPAANDLSWYANILTPCSYMCLGSNEDFSGGYDHAAGAGIVHVANHHIAPGKKQWTWGNHPFGYAWDRNLTDATPDGEFPPYIELMAGVYTDNQPDFSFLQPGETKTWSQYWFPIQKIGPVHHANVDAAVSLTIAPNRIRVGVNATREISQAVIRIEGGPGPVQWIADLAPGKPFLKERRTTSTPWVLGETTLRVLDQAGNELIRHTPEPRQETAVPPPASEPAAPQQVASADELYITGLHLEQYRHATRCPTLYWREALRRDPGDSRCHNAMGLWHLRRGEFEHAESHFRSAIGRLTLRNANPRDGEAHYNLGLCLQFRAQAAWDAPSSSLDSASKGSRSGKCEDLSAAYASFYKATWSRAQAAPGYHALAEIDCTRKDWASALDHLDRSLRFDTQNLRARNLKTMILRRLARDAEARAWLEETLAIDRLDWWARHLAHQPLRCDLQTLLDIAHDYARAGFFDEAIALLEAHAAADSAGATPGEGALPTQSLGAQPMLFYTLGWLCEQIGDTGARAWHGKGATASPDYCFPSRLEEIAILQAAIRANPDDARAHYYLGNLFYDRRRHGEAIALWERSAAIDPAFPTIWRNLGIGYFNVQQRPQRARSAYEKALQRDPADARLLYERDQLWKRLGAPPLKRLRELEKHPDLLRRRDDLSVELCALYNQTGQHLRALEILQSRRFQPWEGGEGQALAQHVRTHVALGRQALERGNPRVAIDYFTAALGAPGNLGEAHHILANLSEVHYWLGCACAADAAGTSATSLAEAREHWRQAATFKGDFQNMSVQAFSELTYYSALAWMKLGRPRKAAKVFQDLLGFAQQLARTPARIDYFATSLPTMLLFDDDLQARQKTRALFLEAQARLGLGQRRRALPLLKLVLKRDPNHALAAGVMAGLANAHGAHHDERVKPSCVAPSGGRQTSPESENRSPKSEANPKPEGSGQEIREKP